MLGNALALLIAIIFGVLGYRSRIPAGTMIGALLSVIVFNTLTGTVSFPFEARAISQSLAGCFIGMSITLEVVRSLRTLIKPAAVLCSSMLISGVLIGFLLYSTGRFDLGTALFSAAAGGFTDVTLVAIEMGADASKMITLHLVRLISVTLICPALIRVIIRRASPKPDGAGFQGALRPVSIKPPSAYPADASRPQRAWWLIHKNAVTIAVAGVGGVIGFLLGIPAGVLIFSMLAVGVFNILTGRGYMSPHARRFAMIFAGTIIGQNIGMDELAGLKAMLIPAVLLVVCFLIVSLVTAFMMHRVCKVDLATALLASTPAGAGEMALIASDLGANTPVVAILHIVRLIAVIALYPQIAFLMMALLKVPV
ncbi:MAG: AbrB family transcriptional regulator [Oscillospiraceae bacterium]|nr:AbrB family transcriptional regulator [Oscillospiraceae bacterium]